jgi:hypothetical protein
MRIELKDTEDMQRYFFGPNADKEYIYSNIHKCIERGILNKLDEVVFCNIHFLNGDEDIDMVCVQDEYSQNLDKVLSWYEQTDQFEKCMQITALKKKINGK